MNILHLIRKVNFARRSKHIFFLTTLFCACTQKQGGETFETSTDIDSKKTCVMSDDSLISVYWWDTGEGGTASDIEAVCQFKAESGDIKEV